jgi:hypothetical protein
MKLKCHEAVPSAKTDAVFVGEHPYHFGVAFLDDVETEQIFETS